MLNYLKGLTHVTFTCKDFPAMRSFYRDTLGLGAAYSDKELTDKLFYYLLWLSLNDDERCNEIDLNDTTKLILTKAYYYHAEALFPLIQKKRRGDQ